MYVPVSNHYTYIFLDIVTIVGPLFLSFDKKVAFYKYFSKLAIATFFTSLIYIIWDILFTQMGVWRFNPQYLIGLNIVNLPIEEYGFFTVVPYACIFIYMCLKIYFPRIKIPFNLTWYLFTLGSILLSILYFNKIYTSITFGLIALTLLALRGLATTFIKNYWSHLILAWIIAIIPMAYVNGVLTSKPVLIYNDLQNMSVRIGTIPFEDFFYNFLYMLWSISIFEFLQMKNIGNKTC